MRRLILTLTLTGSILAAITTPALAHEHVAQPAHQGDGQVLANGALHGAFVGTLTCGGDPAAYGLESAHHGPDSGVPGAADGCYQADSAPPSTDDQNPAIN